MFKVNFILEELEKNKTLLPTYVKVYDLTDHKVIDTFYVSFIVAITYSSNKWESHVWKDGMIQLSSIVELNQSQIDELKSNQIKN
jgi:hypothetical protein